MTYMTQQRSRGRRLTTLVAAAVVSMSAIAIGRSTGHPTDQTATHASPTVTVTATVEKTLPTQANAAQEESSPAEERTPTSAPTRRVPPTPKRSAPTDAFTTDSPGRHDGSHYDNLSPEGQQAHDKLNCADVPGHKKGSCNEPHRKCNLAGAKVVSSGGIRLTCQMAADRRLRWIA